MSTETPKILVAEDEFQIAKAIRTGLIINGYEAKTAENGRLALEIFKSWRPDLVITDLAMPEMDGLELCFRIRETSEVPIIVLSVKGEERTKVEALDSGADDYVTKPFGFDELLARMRALLRRAGINSAAETRQIEIGDFMIDLDARIVSVRGTEVHLTPKEYDLLIFLVHHPRKVITQRSLLAAIWGGDFTEQTEYLRVFIRQLRKKIEVEPSMPRYVVT